MNPLATWSEAHVVNVTTDANGAATAYTNLTVTGRILSVIYTKTDFANGVDFDVTTDKTGQTVWDEDDVNASKTICPRQATHTTAGVAATYDGTRAVLDHVYACQELIKIVVGSGGATKTGKFTVIVG